MQFTENIQANWQEGYSAAQATQKRIQDLRWELPEHLPYSLDLVPNESSEFHLFGPLIPPLVANVSLMMKRLKRRHGSG
jgi:hypothetical protein